jgi:divalent metal cation (Fe/Co/Zn/Cd) transporter
LITIAGVVSLIWYLIILYFLVSNPLYGANVPPTWIAIAATILVPVVVYAMAHYYRKKQGLNLGSALREIPPE